MIRCLTGYLVVEAAARVAEQDRALAREGAEQAAVINPVLARWATAFARNAGTPSCTRLASAAWTWSARNAGRE